MAIWVNDKLPARALVRMSYFTPTILPMVAVANLWLFFYTPQIGLLDKLAALFGVPSHNWLGDPHTVMSCLAVMTVWKEAGFFMIFYLAALQSLSPEIEEAAKIEGASRWYFFRRVTFPLLMPTTLFVLVNATINSFKLVDHLFILTKGGPDNASNLLLYYIYQVAFSFFDTAYASTLTVVLLALLAGLAIVQFQLDREAGALPMRVLDRKLPLLETGRGLAPRLPLDRAARSTRSGRRCTRRRWRRTSTRSRPLTLDNFRKAWTYAPFPRHLLNTIILVTMILAAQLVLCTLAGFAFARFDFAGHNIAFGLVLVQLMVMPEVLIVENYRTMAKLGLVDTILGIGLPYMASAFGIFLLRQTFKTIPRELEEAARVEGCSMMGVLWRVYVPLARPTYLAYALVSVSYHWNNFLWPLIITNSVNTRPLTVGLAIFGAPESGVDWAVISAGTLMAVSPLLVAFLLFQRQFMQSFMQAGIK